MIQLCPVRIARQFTSIHDSGWLWLGWAPHGAPRRGLAWLGKDWRGKAWRGVSRHAQAGRGKARAGRPSGQGLRVLTGGRPPIVACLGKAGLGSSRQGEARLGLAWRGLAGPDKARAAKGSGKRPRAFAGDFGHRFCPSAAGLGRAGRGRARLGAAWRGAAGPDSARQGLQCSGQRLRALTSALHEEITCRTTGEMPTGLGSRRQSRASMPATSSAAAAAARSDWRSITSVMGRTSRTMT